jgi:S1-C subfamily serine protease
MADGTNVVFTLRAIDEHTQLVLLEAAGWTQTHLPQIAVATNSDLEGQAVLGVFVNGPALGQCTSVDRVGLIPPSQRYSPLAEIRFEQPQAAMGGGLVFTTDGKLVGLLNATLDGLAQPQPSTAAAEGLSAQRQGLYGPRDLVVGYSLGSEVMLRVVEGFRSPERRVRHPMIGALFTSAEEGGALITTVNPGSPAQLAGLRIGDVVVKVGETPISNHFDFAKVLFKQKVGAQVPLVIRRAGSAIGLTVRIGST